MDTEEVTIYPSPKAAQKGGPDVNVESKFCGRKITKFTASIKDGGNGIVSLYELERQAKIGHR